MQPLAIAADRKSVTDIVTRIIKSKFAMAVRPTGTAKDEGALPE